MANDIEDTGKLSHSWEIRKINQNSPKTQQLAEKRGEDMLKTRSGSNFILEAIRLLDLLPSAQTVQGPFP